MPNRPAKPCKVPNCSGLTLDPSGYCDNHAALRPERRADDYRVSAARRGYGFSWRKIRMRVLIQSGIPQDKWPLYDIDHLPRYNPAIEPDHLQYTLYPRLRAEHSRKTIREDGGYGCAKAY